MAAFCGSCGAPFLPGNRFCTSCGAPVESPVPPPTPEAAKDVAVAPAQGLGGRRRILALGLVGCGFAIVLATLAFVVLREPAGWRRIADAKSGVAVDYPADVFTATSSADGVNLTSPTSARARLTSEQNPYRMSLDELLAAEILKLGETGAQKSAGANWRQAIAQQQDRTLVRRIFLVQGGDAIVRLDIDYPTSAAEKFRPLVARMTQSSGQDATTPTAGRKDQSARQTASPQPVASSSAPAGEIAYRRIDSYAEGVRLAGARGKVGFSAEVPANWAPWMTAERNVIGFTAPDASSDEIVLSFAAHLRRGGETLAGKVQSLLAGLDAGTKIGRVDDTVAKRPAVLLGFEKAGVRHTIALVEKDEYFLLVELRAPPKLYPRYQAVIQRAADTLGLME